MKNAGRLLFTLLLSIPFITQNAWSQEEPPQLVQVQLPAASEQRDQDTVTIKISDKISYAIESSPTVENMRTALGLTIPDHIREHILHNGGVIPPEVNPLEGYESLSYEKKEQFQKMRMMFLQNVARALHVTKFAFGAGSIVGNSLTFAKDSVVKIFRKKDSSEPMTAKEKMNFAEVSHQAVRATLQALDYKLWNQAPLLLEANEFGISASLGVLIENGTRNSGMGGSEELGLSFAYNKPEKAFVFEVFHNSEKFAQTPALITIAAVMVKAGPSVSQKDLSQPMKLRTGTSTYPPLVPAFKSEGTDNFNTGFASALGFPPIPLVDLLTYSNSFKRNALLRLTVSPVMKGYVRLYLGDVAGSMKVVSLRFIGIFKELSQRIARLAPRSRTCATLFL